MMLRPSITVKGICRVFRRFCNVQGRDMQVGAYLFSREVPFFHAFTQNSGQSLLFRIIYFSFLHSPVPSASVLCRRFLSLAFRSLFHIPESSVGCGRFCPLVVARKRCRGLRSTGLLHARLPAYIEISDHSHDTGRWLSIATRTR